MKHRVKHRVCSLIRGDKKLSINCKRGNYLKNLCTAVNVHHTQIVFSHFLSSPDLILRLSVKDSDRQQLFIVDIEWSVLSKTFCKFLWVEVLTCKSAVVDTTVQFTVTVTVYHHKVSLEEKNTTVGGLSNMKNKSAVLHRELPFYGQGNKTISIGFFNIILIHCVSTGRRYCT